MKTAPLVLIPAFNEEKTIAAVVSRVLEVLPEAEVVVVDDGSRDSTAALASSAGAKVLSLPFNLGYGSALQTGFKYALSRPFGYLVTIDGDGQHDPACITDLIRELDRGDWDLVIGSRFLSSPDRPDWSYQAPLMRRLGMRFFSSLTSLIVGQRITDPTSGYLAMRRGVVEFCTQDIYPIDYPDADVIIMLHRAGFKISEAPVKMRDDPEGDSMHQGLRPLYYIFKVLLSILVTLLRQRPRLER